MVISIEKEKITVVRRKRFDERAELPISSNVFSSTKYSRRKVSPNMETLFEKEPY